MGQEATCKLTQPRVYHTQSIVGKQSAWALVSAIWQAHRVDCFNSTSSLYHPPMNINKKQTVGLAALFLNYLCGLTCIRIKMESQDKSQAIIFSIELGSLRDHSGGCDWAVEERAIVVTAVRITPSDAASVKGDVSDSLVPIGQVIAEDLNVDNVPDSRLHHDGSTVIRISCGS